MCDNLGISDEKVEVYELKMFGSTVIFTDLKSMMEMLHADIEGTLDLDEPEEIIITRKMMRESDVENLPEFEGY